MVHISLDWNTRTTTFVGKPEFANLPGKVTNVVGMGGVSLQTAYANPPDPQTLAFGKMLADDGPLKVPPDGTPIIMAALHNNFICTYSLSAK